MVVRPRATVSGPEDRRAYLSERAYTGPMPEEQDGTEVIALLDDEYARAILVETSREPQSATALGETCDASDPTIYRRLERLREAGLVTEQQQLDPGGHHYKTYEADVERVTVEIEDGEWSVEVTPREEDPADRFTRLYEGLR